MDEKMIIGTFPDDWGIKRVKECFFISKEKANQKEPTVLSLSRAGIKVRDISTNEGQLAASYEEYNPVIPGDLLLNPMDLYSGANCNVSEISGVISPAYINLRSKIKLNPKFFDYYFKVQYWAMAMFAHGKGVSFDNRWTMNTETILNYLIPFPDIAIQNKIVSYLNKKTLEIDELIEIESKQIKLLEEYKNSIISEAVLKGIKGNEVYHKCESNWIDEIPTGWKIIPIKALFTTGKGLPITKDNLVESGIKVISYGQIHSKLNKSVEIDENLYKFVSPEYLLSNPECLVKKGDFIFADTSEDVIGAGDFVYIDNNEQVFAGYHSIILKTKESMDNKYFAYLFMTQAWRNQIQSQVNGVKLFSISKTILLSTSVLVPPREEQQNIINYLNKKLKNIYKIIELKQKKIEELNEYKKTLIYECIYGKKEV